ncbi:MAG TPA: M28 family peptidase [Bryobacteraceae bacterium]|nr:M28 family peptidase [Bryobacteraceae bacterium]
MRRAGLPVCFLLALTALAAAASFDRISPDSLHANITWLAADARQGRLSPSPGLDASADYLAAQFRAAGLAPGGTGGTFFQTADFVEMTPNYEGFHLSVEAGGRSIAVQNILVRSTRALDFSNEPVLEAAATDIAGHVVYDGERSLDDAGLEALRAKKPALVILSSAGSRPRGETPALMDADPNIAPVIRVYSRAAAELLRRGQARLTLHLAAPELREAKMRNVAGVLRGSDPALRDTWVIVSAHYDHLGTKTPGPGNRIYHGANDDASGTASLIEIAKALAVDPKPKRSVLFLALFGEEEGLLGSEYYVRHPLVPVHRTVADLNLEQLGRTDSSDGPEIRTFAFTGDNYSDLPRMVSAAAKTQGVSTYKKDGSDDYFARSDNYSFAAAGIVAHTLVVAFEFPDYHDVGDEANKIDYANLAKVDRGIAAGVLAVADAAEPPKWSNAAAAKPYRDAAAR